MPKSAVEAIQILPETRKDGVAGLAMGIMAFLLYVDLGTATAATWAVALALGIGLAFLVNSVSKGLGWRLNQNVLISGYWTVTVTLFCTLVVESFLLQYYQDANFPLVVLIPILLATIPTCALWLLKAKFLDKNRITANGFTYAVSVTLLGSVAIFTLSVLGNLFI